MQVKISARHGQLDDATQQQLREKGEKLLHFFNRLTMIEITVDLHKERNGKLKVEIVATAEHDHEFVGCDEDADVLHAFTLASSSREAAAHAPQGKDSGPPARPVAQEQHLIAVVDSENRRAPVGQLFNDPASGSSYSLEADSRFATRR